MYWRWNRIPELADLPSHERERLWNEARRDPLRLTDGLWVAVILLVVVGAGTLLTFVPTTRPHIWTGLVIFVIMPLGVGTLVEPILILRYRPVVRRLRSGG
jgi:hypothetical protein